MFYRSTAPLERKPTTLADYSAREAVSLAERRPHVILRDDPYFGRRGYLKRVIPDDEHGFLALVIIFKRDPNRAGVWEELLKPGPMATAYWPPGKVELA